MDLSKARHVGHARVVVVVPTEVQAVVVFLLLFFSALPRKENLVGRSKQRTAFLL
jgi:hypothetical protein|tara:strand:- start:788 stop:952 length:165 start_codon:yes stop_codon:yes gene_type:complete